MNNEQKDILIVDDEPNVLKSLSKILTKKGFNVDTALNVMEATDSLKTTAYKLVLLDINLNDGPSGLTLIESMKFLKLNRDAKVVVISGDVDAENVADLFPELDGTLNKPFRASDVDDFIKAA